MLQLQPTVMAQGNYKASRMMLFWLVGSDAYIQTLLVYQAAKLAGKDGSLDQHVEGLSRRFARKSTGVAIRPSTRSTDTPQG